MSNTQKIILKTDRQQYQSDKERIEAYQELLMTDSGQKFLMDFLINLGFFSQQDPKDEKEAFINHGKRYACNYLLNFLSITNATTLEG